MKATKQKTRQLIKAPQGIAMRERLIGDDIRYTVKNGWFEKLVGLVRKGKKVWIHPTFIP